MLLALAIEVLLNHLIRVGTCRHMKEQRMAGKIEHNVKLKAGSVSKSVILQTHSGPEVKLSLLYLKLLL